MDNSLLEKLKPHWLPISLGLGGLVFLAIGFFVLNAPKKDKPDILFEAASDSRSASSDQASTLAKASPMPEKRLTVDVEGAVEKPGVYDLPANARVQDALIAAGGMSAQADRSLIAKTLNQAAKLTDGAKIYVAAIGDVPNAGLASAGSNGSSDVLGTTTININSAGLKDLDALPGIGEVTAQKIINNRPYGSIDELLSKKIVSAKVFAQIKDKITIY